MNFWLFSPITDDISVLTAISCAYRLPLSITQMHEGIVFACKGSGAAVKVVPSVGFRMVLGDFDTSLKR